MSEQQKVEQISTALQELEGPLLPVLHEVQREFGFIPHESVPIIAQTLNLSRAEVHGVITFYQDFHLEPVGKKRIQVCRAEACQSLGGEALAKHASQQLGLDFDEVSSDGSVSLETVYCLGLCACAPAIRIDDEVYGRVNTALFDALVAQS